MTAIGPYDRIRCVHSDTSWFSGAQATVGAIYTVARVRIIPESWYCPVCGEVGTTGFDLIEIAPEESWAWCACCFAPTWDDGEVEPVAVKEELEPA